MQESSSIIDELPLLDSKYALDVLSDIKTIYTDLDGTLLAPGGKLLCNFKGEPSFELAQAYVALKKVGVSIVIVTGRSRFQGNEFIRIFDADAFIGEMGTTIHERDTSPLDVQYDTGSFEWDRKKYQTPYEAIAATGAIDDLLERYRGLLEYNYPRCLNRDVTHAMRGNVNVDEVASYLKTQGYELSLEDNGMLFTVKHSSLENLDEVHGFHVVPANTSKAIAVAQDIQRRGLNRKQTLAVGDGASDIEMGRAAGVLIVMANGLKKGRNRVKIEEIMSGIQTNNLDILSPTTMYKPLVTTKYCCDGWVEMANAILKAKGAIAS